MIFSILRYIALWGRSLDFRVFFQRSILYATTIVAIALVFFSTEFIVEKWLYSNDEVVDILSAIVGALFFSWFKDFFEKITDHIFFKSQYDYAEAVLRLSVLLGSAIELPILVQDLEFFIDATIKPVSLAIFLKDDKMSGKFAPITNDGPLAFLSECEKLIPRFGEFSGYPLFVADAKIETENLKDDLTKERWKAFVLDAGRASIAAIIPITSRTQVNALLFVGEKRSGNFLSPRDKKLLTLISRQAGMAIHNAKLYGAVKREARELEEQVAMRTERMKSMYDAQAKFFAEMSHEFQTPIAILKMNLEMFSREEDAARKNARYVMETTLDRLLRLTQNFLDVAKLNLSKDMRVRERIDMRKLSEGVLEDCETLAENRGISLALAGETLLVLGDKDKLKEVILNLLSNALKYTPSGGSVHLFLRSVREEAEIVVADNGRGISSKSISRLFERFYRIEDGPSIQHGTGLGLHLCRRIIEAHDGTITVESRVGEGSRFIIHLPLLPRDGPIG